MAAPAAKLSWAQVMAWRAARHHLDERAPAKAMLDVVAEPEPTFGKLLARKAELIVARAAEWEPAR